MPIDMPEDTPDDSHDSFISERNEAADTSVLSDMDNTTTSEEANTTQDVGSPAEDGRQSTVDSQSAADSGQPNLGSEAGATDSSSLFTRDSSPSDADVVTTGEIEVPVVEPPSAIESLDSVPTVAFDYDNYYGSRGPVTRNAPTADPLPSAAPKQKDRTGLMFLGALAAGVLGAVVTVGVFAATGSLSSQETVTPTTVAVAAPAVTTVQPQVTNQIINDIGSSVNPTAVALKVVPSVVTINVYAEGDGTTLVPTGSGSGVVMSSDGYIITNNHVIEGSASFDVTFEDGRTYVAELVGTDPLTDLAVLKISAENLTPVEFGSSDELVIGDPAIAIGNPLGQEGGSSVSVGIVSAFDRKVEFGDGSLLHGMIQTDAAINSGSSGGALVDAEGKLIGITAAIGVSQAGPEGIGYAIPVELVDRITAEIIETGDVMHPFLGVTIGTFLEEAPDGAITPSGSDIQEITSPDSAAGTAGLEPGDVVIRIGDKTIRDQTDLILAVRLNRVGDMVEFEVLRDGVSMTFDVTMGQRPDEFGG